MVQRIFNLLNKEFHSVNQAAFLLGSFALLSQLIGLIRDRSLAHVFGPSPDLDIYFVAFRIPDFLYLTIASLVSITVLIPFLVQSMRTREDSKESRKLLNDVFTVFLVVMILISFVIFILMPLIAPLIAPGFTQEALTELILLGRIMLLSPILLGLSNLIGSITQLFKKFFVFALSPVFYNLGILIGVFFFYPRMGLPGLAVGVVLGALMHLVIQLPVIIKQRFLPKLSFPINFRKIKEITLLSLPRTIALSLSSFSLIVIIALASKIYNGSISIFNLSFHLQAVPLGIIGVSYSVAAFPTLTQFFAKDNKEAFMQHLTIAARQIIFWALPISFLFIVLRAQIVRVIFGSGQFSWADTKLTAAALALFSISVMAQSLILLFVRSYYAIGVTKRPLIINLFSSIVIIILSFVFLKIFNTFNGFRYFIESVLRVEDISGTAVLMLPLAFSIGTILNFFFLWFYIKKDFLHFSRKPFIRKSFFHSFVASFFIAFTAYEALGIFDNIFNINTFWGIFLQGLFSGLIGIIIGVIILRLLKNNELADIIHTLRTKFWNTKVITPQQEDL